MTWLKMQNPVNHKFTGFLGLDDVQIVESPRIELGSKQAINRLSTRLVFS